MCTQALRNPQVGFEMKMFLKDDKTLVGHRTNLIFFYLNTVVPNLPQVVYTLDKNQKKVLLLSSNFVGVLC